MAVRELTTAVNILDTRISYSEIGAGEPFVAFHGNPGSKRDFLQLLENFDTVEGNHCRLIMFDRPGHNGSEELLSAEPDPFLDANAYAKFIDGKCAGKAWLVGYSFGAYVACKLAAKFPEKVKGLILLSPYLIDKNLKSSKMPSLSKNAFIGTFFGIFKPIFAEKQVLKRMQDIFSPVELPEEYSRIWLPRHSRFETLLAEATDNNQMIATHKEVFERLKGSSIKVKALFGAEDKLMDIEAQKTLIVETFADAEIVTIEKAGHALPINNYDICLKAIKN